MKHATNIVHVIFPHKAAELKLFQFVRTEVFLLLSGMLKYGRIPLIRLLWDFFYQQILLRESSSFGRNFSSLNMNKRGYVRCLGFGHSTLKWHIYVKVSLLLLIPKEILKKHPLLKHCNGKTAATIQLWGMF